MADQLDKERILAMNNRTVASLLFTCVILMLLFLTCSKSTLEPEPAPQQTFKGQMVNDIANAVLKPDGTLWMWGHNFTGILADRTLTDSNEPRKVKGLANITAIQLSVGMAMAADSDGNIWHWGKTLIWLDPYDPVPPVLRPVIISNLKGIVQIEIMKDILFLRDDGTIWRLRWNWKKPTQWLEHELVPNIFNVKQISEALALLNDGSLAYIDPLEYPIESFGGLPTDATINSVKQVQNVYNRRTVILKNDGTVWAWGRGNCGENGDGTFEDRAEPVQVTGLKDVIAISANYSFTLALKKDGSIWYWGFTGKEDGENTGIATPIQVPGMTDVELIHANLECLARKKDGSYWMFSYVNQVPQPHIVLED